MPVVLPGLSAVEGPALRKVGTARRLPGTRKAIGDGGRCPANGKTLGTSALRGPAKAEKAQRERSSTWKAKNDPQLVAAARELRDRYLEQVAEHPEVIVTRGKYDVSLTRPAVPVAPLCWLCRWRRESFLTRSPRSRI